MSKVIDSASWDGVTIGLIDAVGSILQVLDERVAAEAKRLKKRPDEEWAWFSEEVVEALADLRFSPQAQRLLYQPDDAAGRIIREAASLIRSQA